MHRPIGSSNRGKHSAHATPVILLLLGLVSSASAQQAQQTQASSDTRSLPEAPLTEREKELLDRIDKLEQRLAALESRDKIVAPASAANGPQASPAATATPAVAPAETGTTKDSPSLPGFLPGTTLNFNLDGYYGYNFNRPVGRVNLLRAYDVLSDSFSLNQAGVIVERAPDVSAGRRLGFRLDLMFGQATETLQGGAQNEPRPQVYRNIFQAYGTYVVPVGSGLTLDFGKWASSLGYEDNYTKDQLNYSRSYYYNFLPFYHFGLRAKYPINSQITIMYHLINGANQAEDFNGFKSQHFALILSPTKTITWQTNYYFGREQRDLIPLLNPGIPILPTQPGLSTVPVQTTPNGREHFFDTYASWTASTKLLLAAEGDYVIDRVFANSTPGHVSGAVGYIKYQFLPPFSLAGRYEYLSDRGGLFSGATQAVKEGTLTATYQFVDGFQIRGELRRDFSNQPFFLTRRPGILKREQDTVTLGLIWWFGGKRGAW